MAKFGPGDWKSGTRQSDGGYLPSMQQVDAGGSAVGTPTNPTATQAAPLSSGTDRSGTASTSSTKLADANPTRRGLEIQNISSNNIGINEFGATAAIGTAGTYTLAAGASTRIRTNQQVNVVASAANSAYTATEF